MSFVNVDSRQAVVDDTTYDVKYFQNWLDSLEKKLQQSVPSSKDLAPVLIDSYDTVQSANLAKRAAEDLYGQVSKLDNPDLLAKVKALVDCETEALNSALDICQSVSRITLESDEFQNLLGDGYDDGDLVTFVVLKQAGAANLANWCQQKGDEATNQLIQFLNNVSAQREFLEAGGARHGEYGRAVQLYAQLGGTNVTHPVLQKLTLAVALELCDPLLRFGSDTELIDPVQRYVHYEQAFMFGELDPAFEHFTVWEMRHIVNCNATNEELGWGRQCLMNYRPDLVYSDDPQWRYCYIVRSDVDYADPEWYKEPRSYDQILSGGGKCGPRAWYGRFICKSFGIPTWGVQQVGHAAMSRWTTKGWETCLGAGFQYTFWEGRGGLDFQLETQAREALNDDAAYLKKVQRLEWIALLNNEDNTSVWRDCLPSPSSPWLALGLMQRKYLATCTPTTNEEENTTSVWRGFLPSPSNPWFALGRMQRKNLASGTPTTTTSRAAVQSSGFRNQIQDMVLNKSFIGLEIPRVDLNEQDQFVIIVPATMTSNPTQETRTVKFLQSFLGGRQLLLCANSSVEYTLSPDLWTGTAQTYNLILRVCTVHRHEDPLSLTISSSTAAAAAYGGAAVGDDVETSIELPYTVGLWEETQPVTITIGGPGVKTTKLIFTRKRDKFAISIKELKLVAV